MDHSQFIKTLYRGLLMREPDEKGLTGWVRVLESGSSPEQVLADFIRSSEFISNLHRFVDIFPNDQGPATRVDVEIAAALEEKLWARVAKVWSELGSTEPFWSVITDAQWKRDEMANREAVEIFYGTGRNEITRMDNWLTRNGLPMSRNGVCAEYGCGVGRCTEWFARRFAHVLAYDISDSHLAVARERANRAGLRNVEFIHVTGKGDLHRLRDIDLFFSIITLQHNPPPIMFSILDHAFGGLRTNGIAFFQVPTYSKNYAFDVSEYLAGLDGNGMEMHVLPQSAVFGLAAAHDMRAVEVSPDHLTGPLGNWDSTSFLFKKGGVACGQ